MAHSQPKYDKLVDSISEMIDHDFNPGDILPSERELSERFELSRTTVRLAMKELERMGLVVRRHGIGTFVADRSAYTADLLQSFSFNDQMRALGRVPSTVNLEFSLINADKNLVANMGCSLGDKVFKIKRLRHGDGKPVMVERTYVPQKTCPTLTQEMLEARSLYDIIENVYGVGLRIAEEESFASIARGNDARVLGISEGAPVLNLVRHTYDSKNRIVEYTLSVARGDQFKYRVLHHVHG